MKRVLLLLVLVAGAALAEEETHNEVLAEPETEAEGKFFGATTFPLLKSIVGVILEGFSVATQVVSLIALSFLIVTLASAKTILRNEQAEKEEEYDYYPVPTYVHGGYDTSGTSSYASGYSKRSLDFPSFLNMPVVQKLTESVHKAIEAYSAQN